MYNDWKRNRALPVSLSVSVILLLAVSTTQLSSNGNIASDNAYAKYSNNQAQSLVNECGINESSGVNCATNGPQIQGDGCATTPLISQSSGQRGPVGPAEAAGP
jgi:hypothetical protein